MIKKLDIPTGSEEAMIDITRRVEEAVKESKVDSGVCIIYIPHTTAGVTINENADPSVRRDLLMTLARAVPATLPFAHVEGNASAHVKASLVGSSVSVLVEDGRLRLGTWQGIFLCEFDGPRERHVLVKTLTA